MRKEIMVLSLYESCVVGVLKFAKHLFSIYPREVMLFLFILYGELFLIGQKELYH